MSKLNVELYGENLGTISQKGKWFDFEVNSDVFTKYQLSSTIMSLAVPLNLRYSNSQKKRAGNFFAELLPEGRNFEWLALSLPKENRTLFELLRKYGKDIAGALYIYDPEDSASFAKAEAEPIDEKKVRYLLEHMPQEALANSPLTGRTSLGGVQGKIVLARLDASWHRVHNGHPSTHILKPPASEYPTMIYDEAFCMQIAYDCGLTEHPVWIENFDGLDALVIQRYDRCSEVIGGRIHQEDFNQALGARGSEKYQENGGKVSAKRIAQTLARFGDRGDVTKFASQLIFSIAIGNLDMHAKNISILHFPDESIAIAPTYDQVPLRHYNTDGKMALAINGKYLHAEISLMDIAAELASWKDNGFSEESEVTDFVKSCLCTYKDVLENAQPGSNAHVGLKTEISSFISNLLSGKSIG